MSAQFALPGLLYRNIATTDLYSADWAVVGASLTLKAVTAAALFAYAFATRRRFGPPAERALVTHSVLSFPNYVVVGVPVLSAMFPPALVKTLMSLLLMEQVSVHLTCVAVVAEVFCAAAPAPQVGEHAHGAMHLHGPPTRTDAHGWAMSVVGECLSRYGGAHGAPGAPKPPAADADAAPVAVSGRAASQTKGTELKPRVSASSAARGGGYEHVHISGGDDDDSAHLVGGGAGGDVENSGAAGAGGEAGGVPVGPVHAMPEHANAALRVLRITRDRLIHNPMVIGAVAVRRFSRLRTEHASRALLRVHASLLPASAPRSCRNDYAPCFSLLCRA